MITLLLSILLYLTYQKEKGKSLEFFYQEGRLNDMYIPPHGAYGERIYYTLQSNANYLYETHNFEPSNFDIMETEHLSFAGKPCMIIKARHKIQFKSYRKESGYDSIPLTTFITNCSQSDLMNKPGVSLAYHIKEKQQSYIDRLMEEGIIKKREFAFIPFPFGEPQGILIIGDINSSHIKIEDKRYLECKIESQWGCNFEIVTFDKHRKVSYRNTFPIYFEVNSQIIVPVSFLEFIKETYLKEEFQKGKCVYEKNIEGLYIKCNGIFVLYTLPSIIYFYSNNTAIQIPIYDFIRKGSTNSFSYLEFYGIDINYWILNERILGFFHTVFSYDNKTVTLYSDEFIIKTDNPNTVDPVFTIYNIILYTLVLLFIGIIILSIQIERIIIKLRPN